MVQRSRRRRPPVWRGFHRALLYPHLDVAASDAHIFGILFLVYLILVLTCAEITIVLCYFQLCGEDYRWWWRSFFTSGSSALYVFMYSAFYFATKLDITRTVPTVMYFCYMGLLSLGFLMITGTVGFVSCLGFVRAIYGSVKID